MKMIVGNWERIWLPSEGEDSVVEIINIAEDNNTERKIRDDPARIIAST